MRIASPLVALCLLSGTAGAVPSRELAELQTLFEYGKCEEALQRARARIDLGGLPPAELVLFHQVAGVCALSLQRPDDAQRHFAALLRLSPDHLLDPYSFPAPAVQRLEELRKQMAPELEVVRLERRAADARATAENERVLKQRALAPAPPLRQSFAVNLLPLGAGQLQQERHGAFALVAGGQAVALLANVISWVAYRDMLTPAAGQQDKQQTLGLLPERARGAQSARIVNYVSAGAFLAFYGAGVWDALAHQGDPPAPLAVTAGPTEGGGLGVRARFTP